jgi:aspartyl-tRNA(Asn)/glutamyl-tRNA(Gln) amidotransferase subunit A
LKEFEKSILRLKDLGFKMVETKPIFDNKELYNSFKCLWQVGCANLFKDQDVEKLDIDVGLKKCVYEGRKYTAVDYLYHENKRANFGTIMNHFHKKYPILVTPTTPITAFEHSIDCPKDNNYSFIDKGTFLF